MVETLLYALALLLSVVGCIGAVMPIIPGPILSFAALGLGCLCRDDVVTREWLLIWLVIVIVVSIADYLLPIYLTKRLGGTKSGVRGATVGLFAGFIFFPPLGIIICPFCGAVIGELMNNRNDVAGAFKVGLGSFLAFILGTGMKLIVCLWILLQLITPPLTDLLIK